MCCNWAGESNLDGHEATKVNRTTTSTQVVFHLFARTDADEMSRLLGEVFSQRDPPELAVGIAASEFEKFVRLYGPKAQAEGLTVVARSVATGEMIGALLAEDLASAPPIGSDQLSWKFSPIFDILGQLDAEYFVGRLRRQGESLHLFLVVVAQGFAGRDIAQRLVAECLAYGGRKGYRMAVTEATNKTSQHLFRKLGFAERVRRSYGDHLFEGQAHFSSVTDQGGPILMDREVAPRQVSVHDRPTTSCGARRCAPPRMPSVVRQESAKPRSRWQSDPVVPRVRVGRQLRDSNLTRSSND
jgi:ribosomal protein S18 acetylase RimI-like enzyme